MTGADERRRILDRLAVALKYEPERGDSAPKVVASGRGYTAERIIEIAKASGVKIHEDPNLVRLLASVEIEREIPVALFAAVAEILALVYRADEEKRRMAG
ncbi:MAG: EscU/YscU/HrcU family type III secretion system export apparatus switch protein [bacterium]|jgi:flagellar biosynthesis protein